MIKNLGRTIKKNPISSFLGIGALAIPLGIDAKMSFFSILNEGLPFISPTVVSTLLLTNFLFKYKKNKWFNELHIENNKIKDNKIKDNKIDSPYKPSILKNAFLAVGTVAIWHGITNDLYMDIRLERIPLSVYMNLLLTPTVLLGSSLLLRTANVTVGSVNKVKDILNGKQFEKKVQKNDSKDLNFTKETEEKKKIEDIRSKLEYLRSKTTEEITATKEGKFKPLV